MGSLIAIFLTVTGYLMTSTFVYTTASVRSHGGGVSLTNILEVIYIAYSIGGHLGFYPSSNSQINRLFDIWWGRGKCRKLQSPPHTEESGYTTYIRHEVYNAE